MNEALNHMILEGNAVDILPEIADKSFDCVITDPPYGLGIEYENYVDNEYNLDHLIPFFIKESLRIANRVVVFPGIHNVWKYPKADWIACWFYGTTGSWGKLGYNSWQPILFYGKNNRRYGMDTIKYSKMEKRIAGHPCSKPLGLMEEVVKRFTDEGEAILDPFAGTGTTILAAKNLGRSASGIEMTKSYCDIARQRLL